MTTTSKSFTGNEPAKKPYESPRLEVYGDIRAVTETVSMKGANDGAAHGMTKTG